MKKRAIHWFRSDLRLSDNTSLHALEKDLHDKALCVAVYISSDQEEDKWASGAASKWWLHHSLTALQRDLEQVGVPLVILNGVAAKELTRFAESMKADYLYYNHRYEPWATKQEKMVENEIAKLGVQCFSFHDGLLLEPAKLLNKTNGPYKVFTPFWNACLAHFDNHGIPLPKPKFGKLISGIKFDTIGYSTSAFKQSLDKLHLIPRIKWYEEMQEFWQPGEDGAAKRLSHFVNKSITKYDTGRDRPGDSDVSFISPHLHFGEISPRQIWHRSLEHDCKSARVYLREIGWRDFAHYLLHFFPETPDEPLQKSFDNFPWRTDNGSLEKWQKGMTGYPIVDAGMRQLWHIGWMHNRVRMIVASFLAKDLLLPWQRGAEWFWDTLVDADLANNTLGWQWTAGCGADAAPFFRIFNPVLQGEKFDPDGDYVRKWVPELAKLDKKWIHKPFDAPPLELQMAGITLGENYPKPIVDHSAARQRALQALKSTK